MKKLKFITILLVLIILTACSKEESDNTIQGTWVFEKQLINVYTNMDSTINNSFSSGIIYAIKRDFIYSNEMIINRKDNSYFFSNSNNLINNNYEVEHTIINDHQFKSIFTGNGNHNNVKYKYINDVLLDTNSNKLILKLNDYYWGESRIDLNYYTDKSFLQSVYGLDIPRYVIINKVEIILIYKRK